MPTLYKRFFVLVTVLLLHNCATQSQLNLTRSTLPTLQSNAIDNWQVNAIVTIEDTAWKVAKSHRVVWQQNADQYRVKLLVPLGMGFAQIKGDSNSATLNSSIGKFTAATPELLLQQHGLPDIPISFIRYWLTGMPNPNVKTTAIKTNPNGSYQSFQQVGWSVTMQRWQIKNEWLLTKIITANKSNQKVTVKINKWNLK